MSEPKHSPAPWRVETATDVYEPRGIDDEEMVSSGHVIVVDAAGHNVCTVLDHENEYEGEKGARIAADAALLAAAPDLLAALEAAVSTLRPHATEGIPLAEALLDDLVPVIAKAGGNV